MKYNSANSLSNIAGIFGWGFATSASMFVQNATQRVGIKFYADQTLSFTGVDANLLVTGTSTGITITAHIETDGGNVPSGTVVGAATAAFACPAASGQTGIKNFATAASLTAGQPYWLVLQDGGGTAPTTSNFWQARASTVNNLTWCGGVLRQFNGTNWTTVTANNQDGLFILQDSLGGFHGQTTTAASAASAQTAIFGTNYQGIVRKFPVPTLIYGVRSQIRLTGVAPGALECVLTQDGGTSLATSGPLASGSFSTNSPVIFPFNGGAGQLVPANVNIYALLHQVGSVGAAGTSYVCQSSFPNTTYISAVENSDEVFVKGTLASNNADPSGLTRITTEIPFMEFLIADPFTDFIPPAGGVGGFFIN